MVEQVIIIGAGQAGLSTAYYLKRKGFDPLILDANAHFGGSWQHAWDSLKLFSPKAYSSLSGYMMPNTEDAYPSKAEMVAYLGKYEQRYQFRVNRPVSVLNVHFSDDIYTLETDQGTFQTQYLVSATGNFSGKISPQFSGLSAFKGKQLHSSEYTNNEFLKGLNVAIIGSGNSGSQVLAEVSQVANTFWFTNRPLEYLADELDGRYLFELSTKRYYATLNGEEIDNTDDFSKIVMIDSVKDARSRGVLVKQEDIKNFTENAIVTANHKLPIDVVICCRGFKTQLNHLSGLNLNLDVNQLSDDSHSNDYKSLWFVGYGEWSGFASATIIGVQKHAKKVAEQITELANTQINELTET